MGSLEDKIQLSNDILRDKPLLRRLNGEAIVSGDLHGDLDALEKILQLRNKLNIENLVLLGDYVDRGEHQIEVISRIAELILDDDKFTCLRGNHEDLSVCSRYGFTNELANRNINVTPFAEFFAHLPIAAFSTNFFMVHGGIPIDEGFNIKEIKEFSRNEIIDNNVNLQLLWNDPIFEEMDIDHKPSFRGKGFFEFGQPVTDRFLKENGLTGILRAHSYIEEGYKWTHGQKILSIFSSKSGPYRKVNRCVARVDLDKSKEIEIIELDK